MRALLFSFVLIACVTAVPHAQSPAQPLAQPPAAPAPSLAPEEIAPDSPRASLKAYIDLCRAGRWSEAARYLSLTADDRARADDLARRLKVVLDEHIWFDFDLISPEPGGRRDDGLAANVENIGDVTIAGRPETLRLVRTSDAGGTYWAFSRAVVSHIDTWYETTPHRIVRHLLTGTRLEPLLLPGPFELLRWQWLALPIILFVAWHTSRPLSRVTNFVVGRLTSRTRITWDDRLAESVAAPMRLIWLLMLFALSTPLLRLTIGGSSTFWSITASGVVVAVFWALWRSTGIVAEQVVSRPWAANSASTRSIVAVGANLARGVVVLLGVLTVLSTLGFPVTTLLAGLGIGGLALAFGAQKTVENIFGSISLAIDQPFRIGDFVQVDDFVGTVENIGLRSTRFRTLDRTLITIPNGQLADKRLESFSVRDRMRLATTICLEYGTTATQMRAVLEGLERVLRDHPLIWPDVVVKFKELGTTSLNIEVMAWFQVREWSDFQKCREDVLLAFMQVVETAGTHFAFPTQTVHLRRAEGKGQRAEVRNELTQSTDPPEEPMTAATR